MTPVQTPLAFMRPRFLQPDLALTHLPFLLWLIDVMRPHAMVQLGIGSGTEYFGLCQALDRLDEGAVCLGLAIPKAGADGTANLPGELIDYNAQHYREFSTLIGEDDLSASTHILGSVDLLVVDEAAGEVSAALIESWLPRLSDKAVIVVHGTAGAYSAKISSDHPTIETREGGGLRAILHGSRQDERLCRMAAVTLGMPSYTKVWEVLRRLGSGLVAEAKVERLEAALAKMRNQLRMAEKRAMSAEAQASEAVEASRERYERAAELEAKLFDLEARRESANSVAMLEARVAELEKEGIALRAAEATRFKELAVLASMIEERDVQAGSQPQPIWSDDKAATSAALRASTGPATTSDKRVRDLSAQVAAMTERAKRAEHLNDALLASTSWKLTGPIRQVGRLMRKRS